MAAAAAFIKSKMPMGQPDSLSDQDAIDVADFVAHQPRPVFAGAKPAGSAKGR
jgi:thiosulfate dehydrogenase